MPIKDLSQKRRLPRLGKIRLGIMVQEPGRKAHPQATDYFVCPPEVQAVLKEEQPKSLPIMLPLDDPAKLFPQDLKMYKQAGLWCAGDGERARRWDDQGNLQEIPCPCPYLENGMCGPEATLNFLLPDVPGIGVWQITTGSQRSIVSLNSALETFSKMFGGLAGIPFVLKLVEEQIQRFDETRKAMVKQTLHVLHLDSTLTMREILEWRGRLGKPIEALMPAPEAEVAQITEHAAGDHPSEPASAEQTGSGSLPGPGAAGPTVEPEAKAIAAATEPVAGASAVGGGDFTLGACTAQAAKLGISPTLWGRYLATVPHESQDQIADLWAALDGAARSPESHKMLLKAMTLTVNKALKEEKVK